jgi:transposase
MNRDEIGALFGVTEESLDTEAREYEDEAWNPASFGKPSPGRPRVYDEDMETVTLRMPHSRILAVEAAASRLGETRSQFMRDAIDQRLLQVS